VLMSASITSATVLAGGPLRIMQACLDVVVPYVMTAAEFGQADRQLPADPGKLADMYVALSRPGPMSTPSPGPATRGQGHPQGCRRCILYAAERATWAAWRPSSAWEATAISTALPHPPACSGRQSSMR